MKFGDLLILLPKLLHHSRYHHAIILLHHAIITPPAAVLLAIIAEPCPQRISHHILLLPAVRLDLLDEIGREADVQGAAIYATTTASRVPRKPR